MYKFKVLQLVASMKKAGTDQGRMGSQLHNLLLASDNKHMEKELPWMMYSEAIEFESEKQGVSYEMVTG